jgi:hypothetical protein
MTPTARSLALLRHSGYLAAVVECWIPHANRRRDLWGFADVLAVHPVRREVVLVQVTTADHLAHRLAKVRAARELPGLMAAGCKVHLHGWKRQGTRWGVKVININPDDLGAMVTLPLPRRHCRARQRLLPGFSAQPAADLLEVNPPAADAAQAG